MLYKNLNINRYCVVKKKRFYREFEFSPRNENFNLLVRIKFLNLLLLLYIYIYINKISAVQLGLLQRNFIMHIRLKIKPNSVRIRSLSCQLFFLPSTEFELTPLIHCSTNRLALYPVP